METVSPSEEEISVDFRTSVLAAEADRLSGTPVYSLEDVRSLVNEIYRLAESANRGK